MKNESVVDPRGFLHDWRSTTRMLMGKIDSLPNVRRFLINVIVQPVDKQ